MSRHVQAFTSDPLPNPVVKTCFLLFDDLPYVTICASLRVPKSSDKTSASGGVELTNRRKGHMLPAGCQLFRTIHK